MSPTSDNLRCTIYDSGERRGVPRGFSGGGHCICVFIDSRNVFVARYPKSDHGTSDVGY